MTLQDWGRIGESSCILRIDKIGHMKWIEFHRIEQSLRKTEVYNVQATERRVHLGQVRFWPKWRAFAFFPDPQTLFEKDCLRDIADFCEEKTKEWREQKFHRPGTPAEKRRGRKERQVA